MVLKGRMSVLEAENIEKRLRNKMAELKKDIDAEWQIKSDFVAQICHLIDMGEYSAAKQKLEQQNDI